MSSYKMNTLLTEKDTDRYRNQIIGFAREVQDCFTKVTTQWMWTLSCWKNLWTAQRQRTQKFYWPCMSVKVEQYIKICERFVFRKTLPQRSSPLNQITSNGLLDLVCIDLLQIEPEIKGIASIPVATDHFMRYVQAFPTKDQKAATVAKVMWDKCLWPTNKDTFKSRQRLWKSSDRRASLHVGTLKVMHVPLPPARRCSTRTYASVDAWNTANS